MLDKEIWKIIEGFPGYEISNHGRIKSYKRKRPQILKINVLKKRNRPHVAIVPLTNKGKHYHKTVSRLVLTAFKEKCPDGMEACHNDGDPTNNHIDNLRWDTHKNNMHDMFKHGTINRIPRTKGITHYRHNFTENEVIRIRLLYPKLSQSQIARQFNVSKACIQGITSKRTWKHLVHRSDSLILLRKVINYVYAPV